MLAEPHALPALIFSADMLPSDAQLNGRRWAARQLLQAWAELAAERAIHLVNVGPEQLDQLHPLLQQLGHRGSLHSASLVHPHDLAAIGGLFLPDPTLGRWAAWRQSVGPAAFSLIGQIHTLSTKSALNALDALVTQPVQPWDALICSSTAGQKVVLNLLECREAQLRQRLGATRFPRPQLPVIPLPLPASSFQPLPSQVQAKQSFGLPAEAGVVLWLGRLSILTKADPWPSYKVLNQLAGQLDRPLVLVECGPDDTPEQGVHFERLRRACPDLSFLRLGGNEPVSEAIKHQALAAADVALSLVDSTQETFGLAVAEAMAAGLPVVASNWNGYRDLIRHGTDGFLIPTRWSSPAAELSTPLGWLLELELQSYPGISGCLAQLVQVDLEAAAAALQLLLNDQPLRRAMGAAGQQQARLRFSTATVMASYDNLFSELHQQRRHAAAAAPSAAPLTLDPVRCFSHYPGGRFSHASKAMASGNSALPEELRNIRGPLWDQLSLCCPEELRPALLAAIQIKHGTMP